MADKDQVISILDFYGASTIVVGHTTMDQITSFYGGLVYAIDTGIISVDGDPADRRPSKTLGA